MQTRLKLEDLAAKGRPTNNGVGGKCRSKSLSLVYRDGRVTGYFLKLLFEFLRA